MCYPEQTSAEACPTRGSVTRTRVADGFLDLEPLSGLARIALAQLAP